MIDDGEGIPLLDEAEPLEPTFRGFEPDQMVACEACLRTNPPTRMNCLYCAAVLPVTEMNAALRRPNLRRLEKWERGFNCILTPDKKTVVSDKALGDAADLLRLNVEELKRIMEAGEPLPVARAATLDEADLIKRELGALHLGILIVSDQDLALVDSAPKRIHALEFAADALVAYPSGGGTALSVWWTEILLFVRGRHLVRRIEVEERRERGSAENVIADTRELSSDESWLDLYTTAVGDGGWRIASDNFDFSCLGERKGLLAAENFQRLAEALRERAPQAVTDDSYQRVRHALACVWPLEQQTESRGLRRERPGKYNVESVIRSDNETQFTRYSRLRHYLRINNAGLKTG